MNEKFHTPFIYLIAQVLNLSLVDSLNLLNQVQDEYVHPRPAYDHFYYALKALPQADRTAEKIAGKLAEHYSYGLRMRPGEDWRLKPMVLETKVVGVTYCGRQEVVAKLTIGEPIILRREPSNLYDCNAIMVLRNNGEQIGYLNRLMAQCIAPWFDALGKEVPGVVISLTGRHSSTCSLGVSIRFSILCPTGKPKEETA